MPLELPFEHPGAIYPVSKRGTAASPILDDADRERHLAPPGGLPAGGLGGVRLLLQGRSTPGDARRTAPATAMR